MHKPLCAAVLLLAAFAFTSGSKSAGAFPSSPTSAVIVAKVKLHNQTVGIPSTTMFTPTQDGLYRVSAYATVAKASSGSNSGAWTYSLGWTDDAGPELETYALQQEQAQPGQFFADSSNNGGAVRTFEAKAGTPITYNLGESGQPDGGEYSLYFVVEQLE